MSEASSPSDVLEPLPPTIRTLSSEDSDRLRKKYPDLQMRLEDCRTCRGQKRFNLRVGADAVANVSCNCENQFLLHRALLNAGIDLHYQRLSWEDCGGVERGAQELISGYALNARHYANEGIGLLLHGTKGTGKTLLVTLLLKTLLGSGYDVYFTTFQELIDMYTQSWRDTEEKAWFTKRVCNAGILGIDDVGREHKGRMEMVESMFDHIVRVRVNAARPTFVTTNKSMTEFLGLYQGNVMSLLTESAIDYEFTGEDYRPEFRRQRIENARMRCVRPIVLG